MCKQNNKWKYQGDSRYEKVWERMQLLDIQDITTDRQHKNGTVVWRLPIKNTLNKSFIEVASFSTGYLRNQNSCHSNYQLNKTKKEKRYVELTDYDTGRPVIKTFKDTVRVLIPIEIDRLEYLISYCLKNYYIGYANKVSSGEFVPKWKHENLLGAMEAQVEGHDVKDVQVIIDGHRYKVI